MSAAPREQEWSSTWPTEPGYYWFYGACWRDSRTEMVLVQVRAIASGVAYIGHGHFIYPQEGASGLWLPATLPDPPETT